MKKFLTTLLAIGLVIAMPVLAVAAAFTLLHQPVPIEWTSYTNQVDTTTSPEIPHLEGSSEVFWHFIANGLTEEQTPTLKATIVFKDSTGKEYTTVLNPYKSLEKMNHYGIYTPYNFTLVGASVDSEIAGKFNLSHVATVATTTTETTTGQTTTEQTTTGTTEGTTKQTTTEVTTIQTTTEMTTTQTSGTTIESSTSVTTRSTTPTTTEDIPKTGEAENFQWTVIGVMMLALAGALAVWKKRLKAE